MRRYIATIDRALLEATDPGDPIDPILVEDTQTGKIEAYRSAELIGARVRYGDPLQNGARVWIEADHVSGVTHGAGL